VLPRFSSVSQLSEVVPMLMLLMTGFVLGLVFNVTPGPVFAETVRQGVRGGFRSALAVQVGSLLGDVTWAIIGLVGIALILQMESLRGLISMASLAYLLWLARDAWRASRGEFAIHTTAAEIDHRQALRAGVLLSLTNAQNVAYWAAMGSALGAIGVKEPTIRDNLLFFAGFMGSCTLWALVVSALLDRIFRRLSARWARLTYRACAIAFLMLALSLVRQFLVSRQPPAVQAPQTIGQP
jgi:chemosensory pili system protein ChpE/L-lysine exporter family protein LysE/ArgO